MSANRIGKEIAMEDTGIRGRWRDKATGVFKGKEIKEIRYTTDKEMEAMLWYQAGPVIEFTDGTSLTVSQDDEGNGPGALFSSDAAISVIPVI